MPGGCREPEILPRITQQHSPQSPETWGHVWSTSNESRLRIMGLNPNGLPHFNSHEKNGHLRALVNKYLPDVLCLAELNVAWHKLPIDQRLGDRMQESFPMSFTQCAWYKDYPGLSTPR